MYRYLVVIEPVGRNYSAHVPDLPGCVATGVTRAEAEAVAWDDPGVKIGLVGFADSGKTTVFNTLAELTVPVRF